MSYYPYRINLKLNFPLSLTELVLCVCVYFNYLHGINIERYKRTQTSKCAEKY